MFYWPTPLSKTSLEKWIFRIFSPKISLTDSIAIFNYSCSMGCYKGPLGMKCFYCLMFIQKINQPEMVGRWRMLTGLFQSDSRAQLVSCVIAWYGCRLTCGPLNVTGSWITYRALFSMRVKYIFSYRNFLKDYFIFMVTSMFQVCHIF